MKMADNFIEVYDNALSADECQRLINYYKKYPKVRGSVFAEDPDEGGRITSHIDCKYKDAWELSEPRFSDNSVCSSILYEALGRCIAKYLKKYKSLNWLNHWKYDDLYTVKCFEGEGGGFKVWHTEHGPGPSSHRVLVWSFYLNKAQGTEFMHFPNIRARMGRCVIWPANWPYVHRSAPNKGVKYYVSGWISYE